MNKRFLILAGGMASRMKKKAENLDVEKSILEQADSLTKGMIGVGRFGRSMIDYQLFNASRAGFQEVLLLLHPEDHFTQEYYERKMVENDIWGLKVYFSRQKIHKGRIKPAGTADAVLQAFEQQPDWQNGPVLILNSDNLYSDNAMRMLWNSSSSNALISYDREALEFPVERISGFAVIRTDKDVYLQEIIEKPESGIINQIMEEQGRVGVSMNAFKVQIEQIIPYLRNTPFHSVRNEKELPTTIGLMVQDDTKAFLTIPLAENVADLTSKQDLVTVQKYLKETYKF